MNKHEKYSIQKYDGIAQGYDASFEGQFTAKFKERMLALCDVSSGGKVLDVGCGNGGLLHAISQKGEVDAYGVDISPGMIAECRKRYPEIDFQVSNGESLAFSDGYFDMLTICCVLHHLNDPKKFFAEAQRVLKPGGALIVGEPWFLPLIRQFFDWVVSPLYKAGDNKTFSRKRLRQLFASHGFTITDPYQSGNILIFKGRK